ncbi:MAG: ribosome small subunit-dependent GTPase A [Firmicutes bacterium HGW-Firmicutes-21]|nr:MAG: ribosome small subunit-dependent GTPase A [Firmicutes bacterium HGW-Firmicutes-21]
MSDDSKTGKILKGQNGLYTVEATDGLFQCHASSKIRKTADIKLSAGDNVFFTDNGDGSGFISEVRERKNAFIRPAVANIDMLAIIVSADEPKPVPYTIDKLSVIAVNAGVDVYIIITKSDIAQPEVLLDIYRKTPFLLSVTNILDKDCVNEVRERLKGRITVLTGASGVGKSSLINLLYPELDTEVGNLSEKIKRGRNTTRVTELFSLGMQTYIADTPGFGMLDFDRCSEVELKEIVICFPDIVPFTEECRYKKCTHTKEEGCAVIQAVKNGLIAESRHESYIRLYDETKKIPQY